MLWGNDDGLGNGRRMSTRLIDRIRALVVGRIRVAPPGNVGEAGEP